MADMAKGPGYDTVVSIANQLAICCPMAKENILKILLNVGFFEERYGSKDSILKKIEDLAKSGCSPEYILSSIKLKSDKDVEIDDNVLDVAKSTLSGLPGTKRAKIKGTDYVKEISKRAIDI